MIEIVERTARMRAACAAEALVPDRGVTKRQASVLADAEACGPDGASLRWIIELKLLVRCNVACSALRICQDAIFQRNAELGVLPLSYNISG